MPADAKANARQHLVNPFDRKVLRYWFYTPASIMCRSDNPTSSLVRLAKGCVKKFAVGKRT
jgi:hypothetical protein